VTIVMLFGSFVAPPAPPVAPADVVDVDPPTDPHAASSAVTTTPVTASCKDLVRLMSHSLVIESLRGFVRFVRHPRLFGRQ